MKRIVIVLVAAMVVWSWGAPQAPHVPAAFAQEAKQLRIVKQPGLGYLQLIVMRELKLIEKRAPGVELEWRQLTSGPVIRDAMIAGQMDIGSGGLGPFRFEMNTDLVFAGLVTVIVIGLVVENFVFRWLERRTVLRWGMSTSH
jgi:ABC-type nitrate/sulfonate/bicarbonate transport system substrate-binding protein